VQEQKQLSQVKRLLKNLHSTQEEHITELFTKHFMSIAWFSNRKSYSTSRRSGYVTPIDSIGYKAANMAYTETFGVPAIPVRSGEVPIVALFEKN
jgi:hypothetical protein